MFVSVTPLGTFVSLKFSTPAEQSKNQPSFAPEPAADNATPPELGSPLYTLIKYAEPN